MLCGMSFSGNARGEWVAYLRRVEARNAAKREGGSNYDDGMSHGIIPFGAVHHWKQEADRRLSAALAHPLPARVVGWDTTAVGLAVVCPWCGVEHLHLVTEDWDPETPPGGWLRQRVLPAGGGDAPW